MKVLIWGGCILVLAVIEAAIQHAGIVLGGYPAAERLTSCERSSDAVEGLLWIEFFISVKPG